jgi:hypothetical protein
MFRLREESSKALTTWLPRVGHVFRSAYGCLGPVIWRSLPYSVIVIILNGVIDKPRW